jgi:outer membrane biosynthesis protein TonB
MTGQVVSVKDGNISLLSNGSTLNLKVSDVRAIIFEDASSKGGSSSGGGEQTITVGTYLVKYKMDNRSIVKNPKIDNLTQEKGTVVVKIIVDRYGNVVGAEPGAPGSNTSSDYLKTKAKQAAESTKFSAAPTGELKQNGTMTITF